MVTPREALKPSWNLAGGSGLSKAQGLAFAKAQRPNSCERVSLVNSPQFSVDERKGVWGAGGQSCRGACNTWLRLLMVLRYTPREMTLGHLPRHGRALNTLC